ncbi:ACT domain-containing protein [Thermopolyspora sp. NPDC052614]|uniref:ACT domain-containing protein n=1 Tax=Thermopolyspora sp. NPDC052614 TaxID=3155682 RepID=UPI00343B6C66
MRAGESAITVSAVRPLDALLRVTLAARRRSGVRVTAVSLRAAPPYGRSEIELRVQAADRDVELLCDRLRRLVDVLAVSVATR